MSPVLKTVSWVARYFVTETEKRCSGNAMRNVTILHSQKQGGRPFLHNTLRIIPQILQITYLHLENYLKYLRLFLQHLFAHLYSGILQPQICGQPGGRKANFEYK